MSLRLLASVLVAMAIGSAPALACKGREVLFEDKFQEEDAGWPEGMTIANGRAEMKPEKGYVQWAFYTGAAFPEADICLDLIIPQYKEYATGGLLFWGGNNENWFALRITTSEGGYAQVQRRQGKEISWLRWTGARRPASRAAPGSTNQLRVVVKGTNAQTFINDRPFAKFKGINLAGGLIGLYAGSETNPGAHLAVHQHRRYETACPMIG